MKSYYTVLAVLVNVGRARCSWRNSTRRVCRIKRLSVLCRLERITVVISSHLFITRRIARGDMGITMMFGLRRTENQLAGVRLLAVDYYKTLGARRGVEVDVIEVE